MEDDSTAQAEGFMDKTREGLHVGCRLSRVIASGKVTGISSKMTVQARTFQGDEPG